MFMNKNHLNYYQFPKIYRLIKEPSQSQCKAETPVKPDPPTDPTDNTQLSIERMSNNL